MSFTKLAEQCDKSEWPLLLVHRIVQVAAMDTDGYALNYCEMHVARRQGIYARVIHIPKEKAESFPEPARRENCKKTKKTVLTAVFCSWFCFEMCLTG